MQDYRSFEFYFNNISSILKENYPPNDLLWVAYYENYARLIGEKNPKAALQSAEKALDILLQNLPEDHIEVSKIHLLMGQIKNRQGKFLEAVDSLILALTVRQQHFNEGNISMVEIYEQLCGAYLALSQKEEATMYLELLLKIYSDNTFYHYTPVFIEVLQSYVVKNFPTPKPERERLLTQLGFMSHYQISDIMSCYQQLKKQNLKAALSALTARADNYLNNILQGRPMY